MLAAARALRIQRPKRIIVAVPVASREACEEFQRHVDQVVCAETPEPFVSKLASNWFAQHLNLEARNGSH
jgi:putative phosphoribosyl transferase